MGFRASCDRVGCNVVAPTSKLPKDWDKVRGMDLCADCLRCLDDFFDGETVRKINARPPKTPRWDKLDTKGERE